ncbi:zinc finger protein 282-like [Columba guinea]|nr:zinc finger protein 282-like [Columba guinea]
MAGPRLGRAEAVAARLLRLETRLARAERQLRGALALRGRLRALERRLENGGGAPRVPARRGAAGAGRGAARGPVSPEDVWVQFSEREWRALRGWQRALHRAVLRRNYHMLLPTEPDVPRRAQARWGHGNQPCRSCGDGDGDGRGDLAESGTEDSIIHIKQEEELCAADEQEEEAGEAPGEPCPAEQALYEPEAPGPPGKGEALDPREPAGAGDQELPGDPDPGFQTYATDVLSWIKQEEEPRCPERRCSEEEETSTHSSTGHPPTRALPVAQVQEWNVDAPHLMPLQPPLLPERAHVREAQLHSAEASLWTVVATVQAMERKIDLLATRLLSLEGRSGTAEKKLLDCEKTTMEFGNQLESKWAVLGTLIQEYGLLQRRLENVENLLKNRNFWVLRLPPGPRGEVPKVPVTFVDIAVYFSAEEWKNLEEWQKELYNNLVKENYESLISLEPLISTSDILSRIKQEVAFVGEQQFAEERGMPADPCAGADALITAHDFLSWIKQEEEPCVREPWELPDREMLPGPGPGEQR